MHLSTNGIRFIASYGEGSHEVGLEKAEEEINKLGIELAQPQFDALVSLVTSIGLVAFRNSALRTTLIGQVSTPNEIRRGFHWFIRGESSDGRVGIQTWLIARRRAEADLFLKYYLEPGGD